VSYSQLGVWLKDPVRFVKFFWPDVVLYSREREIMYSVRDNDETVVVAGNMLGKDFTAALVVLWGEMRRFIQTSAHPLSYERGGPVVDTHLHLRKVYGGEVCGLSYVIGRVAAKGEGMLGHHVADVGDGVPRTLFVADEASGVDDTSFQRSSTWAKRSLVIGNPFPCANHFYRAVKAGDIVAA
jgi:hypothetical protein